MMVQEYHVLAAFVQRVRRGLHCDVSCRAASCC